MPKYHINEETGEPGVCAASIRDCPVGGTHYDSTEEARSAYEQSMNSFKPASPKVEKLLEDEAFSEAFEIEAARRRAKEAAEREQVEREAKARKKEWRAQRRAAEKLADAEREKIYAEGVKRLEKLNTRASGWFRSKRSVEASFNYFKQTFEENLDRQLKSNNPTPYANALQLTNDHLYHRYSNSDIFVIPGLPNGYPTEAQFKGIEVLRTVVSGEKRKIEDRDTEKLVEKLNKKSPSTFYASWLKEK